MSRPDTCGNCAAYNEVKDGQGECRHKPPVIVIIKVRTFEGMMEQPATAFPSVHSKQWCMRRQAKNNAEFVVN